MNILIIILIASSIGIAGIVTAIEVLKTSTNSVIKMSVTAQVSPEDVTISSQQQLADIDNDVTVLDNSTLDKIPVLKNAIDQAYSRFTPPPYHGRHSFTTQIDKDDANSIIQLDGNKVNQLPETQNSDTNLGVSFTDNTSTMEFKLANLYYHVIIEELTPSQGS